MNNLVLVIEEQQSLFRLQELVGSVPQIECPLEHIFSGGVYIRQITIPKGCVIVGKRHRHATCNILLRGELLLICTGDTEAPQRIRGPFQFTSAPFSKKAAYAVEESVFLNIHPTNETDLEAIEAEFIIPEAEYLALIGENRNEEISCLGQQ